MLVKEVKQMVTFYIHLVKRIFRIIISYKKFKQSNIFGNLNMISRQKRIFTNYWQSRSIAVVPLPILMSIGKVCFFLCSLNLLIIEAGTAAVK